MKQKLLNKLWLRVGMIVAIMTTALSGTAWAEVLTYKLTIDASDFNTTSYAANNNEKTSTAVCTTDNTKTYEVKWTSYQVMKNGNNMQWQKSKGYIYNSTDLGTITSVTVTSTAGSYTTYYGTSEQPSSSTTVGGGFFQTKVGSATGTTSKIEITFEVSALNPNDLNLTSSTLSFDLGGTTTSQLSNSGQADGAITWTSSNPAVATVDNSGNVTAVEIGTAVITATQAASSTYQGGTATCTVTVVDSRYTISDLTFTAKCNGSGTADDGAVWTVTSDASESTFDSNSGIHYGTNNVEVTYLQLTTSSIMGTVAKVVVNTCDAQACATVSVTVGGDNFLCGGATTATATNASIDYVFTGTGEGQIVVRIARSSEMKKAIYVKSVKVYYTPSTDPVINATDPAELAYDATSGEFDYTITNSTSANLNATSNADWITNVAVDGTYSKVTFNTTANSNTTQRTGTITLTYTGATDKVVTITQAGAPMVYTTIPALFDKATEVGSTATDVNVTFNNWVVSGVSTNGKNVFVTDNSGKGFVIYYGSDMRETFAAGKILSGTAVSCKVQLYNGFAEVTNLDASNLTITDGGTVSTANIALADLSGVHTGALVHYENLTCSIESNKYYLSDGTTNLQVYNALYAFGALEAGKTYNITGVYQQFNDTKEILPRSAADIVEVVSAEPSITLASYSVEATATTGLSGTIDVDYDNITSVASDIAFYESDGTTTATYDWITVEINSSDNVEYLMDENDGAARTAYFKVWAYDDDMNEVYSGLVTVTQAAYVAPVVTITTDGNYFVKVTSTADITDGAYLIVYEGGGVAFNGNLETLDATSNTIDVTIKNGVIVANSTNKAAAFFIRTSNNTMMTQNGKYVGKTANSNGMDVKDDEITNTFSIDNNGNAVITASGGCAMKYNSATDQLRFRYYKSGQKDIQLYKLVDEAAGLNSEGYATFASTSALDFSGATDYSAWAITAISGENITFTQVTGAVPAGTGVLLKGTASTPVVLTTTTGATTAVNGNKLVGITSATDVTAGQYYGLSGNEFVPVNAGTVPAGKALLPASALSSNVKAFTFIFEDDATGINEELRMKNEESSIYNLAGQRLDNSQFTIHNSQLKRGIYIVNGKKVLK